ncbi:hypothetical protein Q8A67_004831 [Cirrhinus molitorella]|uniref:Uncharacterized protein n=1 Tax=Cirrhinus molitorella TaxID=172907 RepID=A0AA88Q1I5_9TELE|nr:hypothetical protein Q8A67_004831 [Cirrhinus molitorella]
MTQARAQCPIHQLSFTSVPMTQLQDINGPFMCKALRQPKAKSTGRDKGRGVSFLIAPGEAAGLRSAIWCESPAPPSVTALEERPDEAGSDPLLPDGEDSPD